MDPAARKNKLQTILSPQSADGVVWIHQDAWFNLGTFDKDVKTNYTFKGTGTGVYAFVIKGSFKIDEQELNERDGLGLWNATNFDLTALTSDAEILLMEVPMNF